MGCGLSRHRLVEDGIVHKAATSHIKDHPLVKKRNRSIPLDDGDLARLARLLKRKIIVKKAKDIIVEGYKYEALHIMHVALPCGTSSCILASGRL